MSRSYGYSNPVGAALSNQGIQDLIDLIKRIEVKVDENHEEIMAVLDEAFPPEEASGSGLAQAQMQGVDQGFIPVGQDAQDYLLNPDLSRVPRRS